QAGGKGLSAQGRQRLRRAFPVLQDESEADYLGVIRIAPSRRIVSAFSISTSTIAFTSCAYSAGRPRREGNGTCLPSESCASFGNPISIGVSKMPGAMVHTRMPLRERSRAIGSVIPTTPPFDAE